MLLNGKRQFPPMPLLITSVSLVHYCCTHPSRSTTSSPNANTGLGLPIIISTLSKMEGNAICNRFGGAHNSLEGDHPTACWFYDQFKLAPWQPRHWDFLSWLTLCVCVDSCWTRSEDHHLNKRQWFWSWYKTKRKNVRKASPWWADGCVCDDHNISCSCCLWQLEDALG